MKSIHFPNKEAMNDIVTVDLCNFISQVTSEGRFADSDIYFMGYNRRDEDDSLMTRVHIDFNAYTDNMKSSISWRWHSYRAKNFCCFNNSFERMSE